MAFIKGFGQRCGTVQKAPVMRPTLLSLKSSQNVWVGWISVIIISQKQDSSENCLDYKVTANIEKKMFDMTFASIYIFFLALLLRLHFK